MATITGRRGDQGVEERTPRHAVSIDVENLVGAPYPTLLDVGSVESKVWELIPRPGPHPVGRRPQPSRCSDGGLAEEIDGRLCRGHDGPEGGPGIQIDVR